MRRKTFIIAAASSALLATAVVLLLMQKPEGGSEHADVLAPPVQRRSDEAAPLPSRQLEGVLEAHPAAQVIPGETKSPVGEAPGAPAHPRTLSEVRPDVRARALRDLEAQGYGDASGDLDLMLRGLNRLQTCVGPTWPAGSLARLHLLLNVEGDLATVGRVTIEPGSRIPDESQAALQSCVDAAYLNATTKPQESAEPLNHLFITVHLPLTDDQYPWDVLSER